MSDDWQQPFTTQDQDANRILVVDDSALNREILAQQLEARGFHAFPVESGQQALDFLRENAVDLILLDVMMPEMDGFEALSRIRKTISMNELPIIMITALNKSKDIIKALTLGANDYITKPIDISVALARIHTQLSLLQSERALRESEERYALAAQGANDGLWDWNLKTQEIYFSPRWKSMLGFKDLEIGGVASEWFDRIHPDDLPRVQMSIERHLDGDAEHFTSEYRILHKKGNYVWVFCRGIAVRDDKNRPNRMAGSQTDITHHGMHDVLTGLPKRALFMHSLNQAVGRLGKRKCFAIHYIDLDRFKLINDSFGHEAGDQVLITVVRRLESCLSPQDTLARLEGDVFAVLQNEVEGPEDAAILARKMQAALAKPMLLDDHEVTIEASIGISLADADRQTPERLLRDAHTALFEAKNHGQGNVEIFDGAMHAQAMTKMKMESGLRQTLKESDFSLNFQPQVHLDSGEIVGMEVLIRWHSNELGWVGPSHFIPIAEETGLIIPIGAWVINQALEQVSDWYRKGLPKIRLAINLSARQFTRYDLVDEIAQGLKSTGFDPGLLELEITESTLMQNIDLATRTLRELHGLGVSICIDDFGTGYSSLSYLKRFPIDCLKIDRSFIRDVPGDPDDAAITSAIVAMAHHLKMKVIAEGVENEGQVAFLKSIDCEEGQGFFFSLPLASEDMQQFLERRLTQGECAF